MRIAYAGGGWATNIGNSFYNLGALHLLREVVGPKNAFLVPDTAGWIWRTGNSYDVIEDVDAEIFVFSGPYFCEEIVQYARTFQRIVSRGGRIGFVSVGGSAYTDSERQIVFDALTALGEGLAFVATRDSVTYEAYRTLPCPTYDGICASMFLNDAVVVPELRRPPYVVLNFEPPEPRLTYEQGHLEIHPIDVVPAPRRAARLFKSTPRNFARPGTGPTHVGPYEIVRTQSRSFVKDAQRLFPNPTTHYYDIPTGYLAIYKSAEIVFTNRVHTAAATLILGGTARYVSTTPRARDGRQRLLDRIGAGGVRDNELRLDIRAIEAEKAGMRDFLRHLLLPPVRGWTSNG